VAAEVGKGGQGRRGRRLTLEAVVDGPVPALHPFQHRRRRVVKVHSHLDLELLCHRDDTVQEVLGTGEDFVAGDLARLRQRLVVIPAPTTLLSLLAEKVGGTGEILGRGGVLLKLEGAVADAAAAGGALGGLVGQDAEVVVDPAETGAPRRLDALAHLRDVLQNRRVRPWVGGWGRGGVGRSGRIRRERGAGAYLVALRVEGEGD